MAQNISHGGFVYSTVSSCNTILISFRSPTFPPHGLVMILHPSLLCLKNVVISQDAANNHWKKAFLERIKPRS